MVKCNMRFNWSIVGPKRLIFLKSCIHDKCFTLQFLLNDQSHWPLMMVHAGSVHIHLRQPIQCAPESAMGCQSAQTGPGHARGRSLEENHKKCHREVYIYWRNFTNSWAHHWSGMKNPAVVALCQNEISWLASDLSASFLPQHFPRHSPKLPGFYLGYPPSSLKHKESIDTAGLEVDRDEPVNSDMVWLWLGVTN